MLFLVQVKYLDLKESLRSFRFFHVKSTPNRGITYVLIRFNAYIPANLPGPCVYVLLVVFQPPEGGQDKEFLHYMAGKLVRADYPEEFQ